MAVRIFASVPSLRILGRSGQGGGALPPVILTGACAIARLFIQLTQNDHRVSQDKKNRVVSKPGFGLRPGIFTTKS